MQEHYTDTIFYQIELTAKYCKLLGQQAFEQLQAGINLEDYAVLDTLITNKNMCQRDLAKLILKDRANTGKLLDSLEKRGLIKRKLSIKNNRPVKIIEITPDGEKKVEYAASRLRPHYWEVMDTINHKDIGKVGGLLKDLRKILKETIEIQI